VHKSFAGWYQQLCVFKSVLLFFLLKMDNRCILFRLLSPCSRLSHSLSSVSAY